MRFFLSAALCLSERRAVSGPPAGAGRVQVDRARPLSPLPVGKSTFINYLRVCPIYPDRDPASKPSHYLGILRDLMADACADDARFGTESMACPLCGGTGRG